MTKEPVNNPEDPTNEMFTWLEAQVTNINHNVSLIIVALTNKLGHLVNMEVLIQRFEYR